MIKDVERVIDDYFSDCQQKAREPTIEGISNHLEVTSRTLRNVCAGHYSQGKAYTDKPSINRAILNDDFHVIREVMDDIRAIRKAR